MTKILLIEDEAIITELIQYNLEKEGYLVYTAKDGLQGIELTRRENPDLILLDLMLPMLDGFEVCKTLRLNNDTAAIPIIVLSARDDVVDKVIALELGADDYLAKPFNHRELSARIKARLREGQRRNVVQNKLLKWGELEIDVENYLATIADQPLDLTVKEFDILVILAANPYLVFSREYLIQKIWGTQTHVDTRSVDVHVSNLRNKLKTLGPVIESARGIGYRFAVTKKK